MPAHTTTAAPPTEAKNDIDRAIADYSQAIDINPRYANAYFNRGSIYETKGANDLAIADLHEGKSKSTRRTLMPILIAASLTGLKIRNRSGYRGL